MGQGTPGPTRPMCAGRCAVGRHEDGPGDLLRDACPRGRDGGSAPLCGAGMNPPFLFVLTKRNGPFTVQRETAWAQNRRQKAPFLLKTRGSTRDIGQLRQDSALGAGPALLNLSVVSPRLGIAKSECEIDLTCFPFRCRCRSQTPGGESRPRIFTRGLPTSFPLGVG